MRVDLLQRFTDLVGPPGGAIALFDTALVYSAALQDGEVWPELRAARRELERAASEHCRGREGPIDIVQGVLDFMREAGFVGDMRHYEDPRNSLIDRVLERRLGLPISLSVVAIHLAERCGVELHGVGFPGHFLVGLQLELGGDPQVWDPFRGGRRLQHDELAAIYTAVVGHHVEADSAQLLAQLRPCDSRLVLTRMLENIRRHYHQAGEPERVADTLELLAALHPEATQIRDALEEHPCRRDLLN